MNQPATATRSCMSADRLPDDDSYWTYQGEPTIWVGCDTPGSVIREVVVGGLGLGFWLCARHSRAWDEARQVSPVEFIDEATSNPSRPLTT